VQSHRDFRTNAKSLLRSSFFPRRIVLALTLSTLGAVSASAFAQDPSTARVSVADDESQANGGSHSVDISGEGRYITFASSASNLVSGGTSTFDVYVRDHTLGTTELISQSTSGAAGNSTSGWPSISRDGRYVVFMSIASTLVSDDDNGNADVFLHDRMSGTTSLISREEDGTPGDGRSERPEISADGMHVAFVSTAPNLVAGVTGNHTYVYHVANNGTIELISQSSGEVPGNGSSSQDFPSISDDGRYVVFRSTSTNLGPDQNIPTNAGIFLRNTVNGTTDRYAAGFSFRDPAISGNGTWISYRVGFMVYGTERTNTTPGVFSFAISGGPFEQLRWSADGRFLVFFEQEGPFSFDPWRPRVYDRVKDNFIEVAITHDGFPIDRGGAAPNTFGAAGISDNGRFVAFWAEGTTIVLGDTNGVEDVFLRDIGDILAPNVVGLRADPPIVGTSTPVVISATIDDAGRGDSVIVSADISLDSGGFQPLSPEDGSFDSPAELVSRSYVGLSGGMHEACVRGTDEFGNTGASDCVSFEVTVEGWPLTVRVLSIEDLNGGYPAGQPVNVRALVSAIIIPPTDLADNSKGIVPNGSSIEPPWEYMGVARSDQDPAIVVLEAWSVNLGLDAAPGMNDRVIFSVDLNTGELTDFPYGRIRCSKGDTPGRAVRICYEVELSRDLDPDGDAIPTVWEVNGLDVDGDGVVDVDLAAMGADPMRKDLFVEIDCLFSDGNSDGDFNDPEDHNHCPSQDALNDIVKVFANAPLDNPDGSVGIQLHVDIGIHYGAGVVTVAGGAVAGTYGNLGGVGRGGDKIPEAGNEVVVFEPIDDYIDSDDGQEIINANPPFTRFGDLKAVYFDDARRPVFRYSLWAHQTAFRNFNRDDCTSGLAERVPSDGLPTPGRIADDHLVTLGGRELDEDGNDGFLDLPCWSTGPLNNIDDDGDGKVDEDPEDGIDNDGDCVAGTDTNNDGIACGVGDIGVDEDGGFSVGSTKEQAGIFVHEFAHNLGLAHGGIDNFNRKPNHRSVLNYARAAALFKGTATFCNVNISVGGPETCDLSREELPTLNELSFDECQGFDSGKTGGLGKIDVNDDGQLDGESNPGDGDCGTQNIEWDLNDDKKLTELSGSDDWANINFGYRHREAAYGVSVFAEGFTPADLEAASAHLESMSRAQVDVGLPSGLTVVEGEPVQFDVQLASTGQGPALQIEITSNGFAGSPISDLTDILQLDQSTSITLDLGIAPQMPGIHVIPIRISYASLSGKLTELALETSVTVLSSNLPPTINIGEDPLILEGNTLGGWSGDLTVVAGVTASDPDGDPVTLINDAPSFFVLGVTTVTWTATDTSGNTTTDTQQVTVIDTTAPELSLSVSPTMLWPPNHKMIPIGLTATASDVGDPNPIVELVIVQSSEGENIDTFDPAFDVTEVVGKKGNDIQLVDGQLFLRAERSGNSDGRVYSITYQATDASGNSTSATVTVEVPHNQ
jgi:Tol biopolymer transport system component